MNQFDSEYINKFQKHVDVTKIPSSEIKSWLLEKHYAHTIPAVIHSFGLFINGDLEGVCCYGSPACPSNNSLGKFKQIELVRLVVNEGLLKNTLSHFVSSTFKLLPKPLSLISYADNNMGHHGYIYQSTNWLYTGLGEAVSNWVDDNGNPVHNRTMSEKAKEYPNLSAVEVAHKLGYQKVIGSSKYRYYYFIGNKRDKRKWLYELTSKYNILPYPKGENRRYKMPKDTIKTTNLLKF